jgi:murein hydrolase activator
MRIMANYKKLLLGILALCMAMGVYAQPPSRTELETQKKAFEAEISALNKELQSIKGQSSKLFKQSSLIEEKIRKRNQIVGSIDNEIDYLGIDISNAKKEINKLQKDLDTLKMQYAKTVVFAYKNRSNYDFLNFIFSSDNFNNAMKRVTYLKTYRDYQTSRVENIIRTKKFLQDRINILQGKTTEKREKYKEQAIALKALEQDNQEKMTLANEFKAKEGELSKQIDKKRAALNKISSNITAIIERISKEEAAKIKAQREADKLAKAEKKRQEQAEKKRQQLLAEAEKKKGQLDAGKTSVKRPTDVVSTTPKRDAPKPLADDPVETAPAEAANALEGLAETKKISSSFSTSKGRLPFPVDGGYVVTGFGTQTVPGTSLKFVNPGISIEGPVGAVVKAIFDGEVYAINVEGGGIYTIYIRHGKYISTYSNVTNITINKGDRVTTGQTIGKMAAGEEGEGALDFILSESTSTSSRNIDPSSWIRRN